MRVLSLFDGISCARVALDRAGLTVEDYFASEIDKYAITISQSNWPDIKHVGSVVDLPAAAFGKIDLLIGGSPCQDLSIAKIGRKGLAGERSKLFWEYVRLLKELKPKYFILENVNSMPAEAKAQISKIMGVEPIMIDAGLVSAQQRKRLFWTNIPGVGLPEDRGIMLKDILESGAVDRDKSLCIDANYYKGESLKRYLEKRKRQIVFGNTGPGSMVRVGEIGKGQSGRVYSPEGKSTTLQANGGGKGAKTGLYFIEPREIAVLPDEDVVVVPEATKAGYAIAKEGDSIETNYLNSKTRRGRVGSKVKNLMTTNTVATLDEGIVRKLSPLECERLQSLPDGYTAVLGVSNSQRYKTLGNAFNADVITHILSHIPNEV